jgi:hypothetical protein
VVQTQLNRVNASPVRIDYVMHRGPAGWQVVDVLTDGTISRVAVQRSDFRSLLMSGGVPALTAELSRKTANLTGNVGKAPDGAPGPRLNRPSVGAQPFQLLLVGGGDACHEGCSGRATKAELRTGTEAAVSGPVGASWCWHHWNAGQRRAFYNKLMNSRIGAGFGSRVCRTIRLTIFPKVFLSQARQFDRFQR